MGINLPQINPAADNWIDLITRVNDLVAALGANTVTVDSSANGSPSSGNGFVSGVLGSSVLVASELRGGNVQSSQDLTVSSNVVVGNSTSNVTIGFGTISTGMFAVNSTVATVGTVSMRPAEFAVGSNVVITPSIYWVGNSTSNTFVSHDGLFSGSVWAGVDRVRVGNSTSSASMTQAEVRVGNSTVNSFLSQSELSVGGFTISAGQLQIGNNVLSPDGFSIGLSSVFANSISVGSNVVSNSSSVRVGNSTLTTHGLTSSGLVVNTSQIILGANLSVNSSSISVGNSTSNVVITGGGLSTSGVTLGQSSVSVGSSTVNSSAVSVGTAVLETGRIQAGAFSANATQAQLGSNVVANTSSLRVGNSTVSSLLTSLGLSAGSMTANSTQVTVGNTAINSTSVSVQNLTVSGTVSASINAASLTGTIDDARLPSTMAGKGFTSLTDVLVSGEAIRINYNTGTSSNPFIAFYSAGTATRFGFVQAHQTNGMRFVNDGGAWLDVTNTPGLVNVNGSKVWHAGNGGSGSGMDADTVDGVHASGLVPTSRNVSAGNGLTGGGSLAADRTITLGTPGTLNGSTGNSVDASTHTHNVDFGHGNAVLGTGVLGTYALMKRHEGGGAGPGALVAGSQLRYASAEGNFTGAPAGTWRCMGYIPNSGTGESDRAVTVWMRAG